MSNLFTNLNQEEEASLAGGTNNVTRRRVGISDSHTVAVGGNGGNGGNGYGGIAVGVLNSGYNSADGIGGNGGNGGSASATSANDADIAVS